MAEPQNPFPVSAYYGPEYFCDRTDELKRLQSNIENGINTTLLSIRRMGKTGLLHHLFYKLSRKKDVYCLYTDIYATQNQNDLVNQLATAVYKAFPPKKPLGKKVFEFLTSLRPLISYDSLTGQPELSFHYSQPKQQEQSLTSLLTFLDSISAAKVVIAIDEFQQINEYPEKNTEALLRTSIQPLKNVRFIFSGSSKDLLSQIFTHQSRPFFGSTQLLELNTIPSSEYQPYIEEKFIQADRTISAGALTFISEWTRLHTYYTQVTCNRLFAEGHRSIDVPTVQQTCLHILEEQEVSFFQYRNLLTPTQWQLLKAIAKEQRLYQPNSKEFISRYKLGTPSNIQRALEALMSKEMVYKAENAEANYYSVYDCFLSRWLERL